MFKQLLNLSKVSQEREDGQGLVEYALILVLVSVVVVVILSQMGPAVGNIFSTVVGALNGGVVAGEEEQEECLTDTNVHFRFPSGADTISQPFYRYDDSNCETNEVRIPSGDAQYMLRRSAYPDPSATCTSLLGYASNILDPGPSSDVVWCR